MLILCVSAACLLDLFLIDCLSICFLFVCLFVCFFVGHLSMLYGADLGQKATGSHQLQNYGSNI